METNDTWLVVPCYNEAARLDGERFLTDAAARGIKLLFVDDGSRDGTFDLLSSLARREPDRVRLHRLPVNRGKAEAVRQGMNLLFRDGYRYGGYWDADLATPLAEVASLRRPLEEQGALMALGSRVKLLGRQIERKASRHYAGRVFATAASLTLNLPVYDTQCGAKLFDLASPAVRAAFAEPFTVGWIFDVEMIARFLAAGREAGGDLSSRIVEIPLARWVDVAGSKVGPVAFVTAVFDLLKVVRRYSPGLYRR